MGTPNNRRPSPEELAEIELTKEAIRAERRAKPGRNSRPGGDPVNHPRHYTSHPSGIEAITIVEHFGFNLGNVIKYIWRAEEKGAPIEDLRKASWYLSREIARREGKAT